MSLAIDKNGEYQESPVHGWFGLSYSSYLVLPRSLMEGMPFEWQEKMVELLEEAGETYDYWQIQDTYTVHLRAEGGRFAFDPLREYRRPGPLPYLPGKDPRDRVTANEAAER